MPCHLLLQSFNLVGDKRPFNRMLISYPIISYIALGLIAIYLTITFLPITT